MYKIYFILFHIFLMAQSNSSLSPNETKIYFHIHQATRLAELYHNKNSLFTKFEMQKHLGKIKYTEMNLVKSQFYNEYIHLNKLAQNLKDSSYTEIEKFREKIHAKATQLAIEHPKNWRNEFFLIR